MASVRASYYTTVKLGPKRSLTPEGFLLCEEVPLARTGMMLYGPNETPIKPGPDGITKIFRDASDLFTSATLGSANGKSVTVDHPPEDVTPKNVKDLEVGVCLSPRRGDGAMDDLMLGDLLIKAPEGISAIQDKGIEEISLGYDADYEETGEGTGRQSGIIINHIALVEQGRCGPRCAIGDQQTVNKGASMAKKTKFVDFLMRAFKAKDAAEIEKLAEEAKDSLEEGDDGEGETHIHVHTNGDPAPVDNVPTDDDDDLATFKEQNAAEHKEFRDRIEALEKAIAGGTGDTTDPEGMPDEALDEFPDDLKEDAKKAKDSAHFRDSFQDTVAMAEILSPGIRVPTYDSASKPSTTYKKICGLRRQALDAAYASADTKSIIDTILGGKKLDTTRMTCDAVRTLFRSAAAMRRVANNGAAIRTGDNRGGAAVAGVQAPRTLADVNKANAEYWAKH